MWELDVPLVVWPLKWFFCLLGCGSFHFFDPCIPSYFFGCFGLFIIGRVSPAFQKKGKELANEHQKEPRPQDHEKWVPILEKNKMMGIICFPLEAAVEVFDGVMRHFKKIPSVFWTLYSSLSVLEKRTDIREIRKVTLSLALLSSPNPSFSGILQRKEILVNLSMKW
jgi:hypothetical protein